MLDKMRKHSRSFIIYIFFGIIIAVFVINFGPQSRGCTAPTSHAGEIDGAPITHNDFKYALGISDFAEQSLSEAQMGYVRSLVMDRFLVRQLFADEAHKLGMSVAAKEVDDMVFSGRYIGLGEPKRLSPAIRAEDGSFDYDLFSRYVRYNWRVTVRKFIDQQRTEMLADKLRDLLRAAVQVTEEEAKQDYVHEHTKVQLQYVRFDPSSYRDAIDITPSAVAAFVKANPDKIKEHFEANRPAYLNLPPEVLLREIEIRFDRAGGPKQALMLAHALQKRIRAKEAFQDVVRSAQAVGKASSRLLGWRNADDPGLGAAAKAAVKQLEDGQVSDVLTEQDKLLILKVEKRREGNQTLHQVEDEIARALLTDQRAREQASAEANKYLERAKAGEKLTDLFTEEADQDSEAGSSGANADANKKEQAESATDGGTLKLQTTDEFTRSAEYLVPGIGLSEALTRTAFNLKKGELAGKPFTVGNAVFLVALKDRSDPDLDEWKRRKDEIVEAFQRKKWRDVIANVERALCEEAVADKRITVNAEVVTPPPPPDAPPNTSRPPPYVPCKTLQAYPY